MKMEHAIRAPREGVVSRVLFGEGDLVEAAAVLRRSLKRVPPERRQRHNPRDGSSRRLRVPADRTCRRA
jgi:hypothetical protein